MSSLIPKIIHQVWIGPLEAPQKWMRTWQMHNPDWEYMLWDNETVFSRTWKTQKQIDEYLRAYNEEVRGRGENGRDVFTNARGAVFHGEKATLFAWHVIADLIRYEILYEYGGYMPGADTECIKPMGDRFDGDFDIYTVRTGHLFTKQRGVLEEKYPQGAPDPKDKVNWHRFDPYNASPILASKKKHPFLKQCINELSKLKPEELGEAVDTTGNVFMGKMLKNHMPEKIKIVDYIKRPDRDTSNSHSIHYSGTMSGSYDRGRYRGGVIPSAVIKETFMKAYKDGKEVKVVVRFNQSGKPYKVLDPENGNVWQPASNYTFEEPKVEKKTKVVRKTKRKGTKARK